MRAKLKFSPNCCARAVWLAVLLSLIGCGEEPNPAVELARQLREGDAKDRYKAAKALEDHGSSASVAIPELTVALSDENAKLRYRAVKVLSKIDDLPPSVVAPLADLLSSDDEQTRYYAAKALANTDDAVEPKLSVLIDAMKGDNPTKTQFYLVECMKHLGEKAKDAIPVLETAAKSRDKKLSKLAEKTLAAMK